jgi:hypothetical protein
MRPLALLTVLSAIWSVGTDLDRDSWGQTSGVFLVCTMNAVITAPLGV